jgi:hypothetical protein
MNLSGRQAASPARHDFIVKLMQRGASLPREGLHLFFVDMIRDRSMAEAVRQRADHGFADAIERVREVHFVNQIVDAGTVPRLKSIVCPLTNPHAIERRVLLA